MSASFELAVAQEVARMRALERALYDEGPWAFRVGDVQPDGSQSFLHGIPADRRVDHENQCVVFTAELESSYDQSENETSIDLMTVRDRELVSSRVVVLPPGPVLLTWKMGLREPVAA
jgi:hypothetical protein